MTPWLKKTKLHIIGSITVCGLIVAVVIPNYRISAGKNNKEVRIQTAEYELESSSRMRSIAPVTVTGSSLAGQEISLFDNTLASQNNVEPAIESEASEVLDLNLQETIAQGATDAVGDDDSSDLLSMGEEDVLDAEESIGAMDTEGTEEATENEEPAPDFYTVGVRHSSVADIQQRLMDLGFMDYAEPTDYYGNITSESVKMFQRQNDLKQDGIIGPETKDMLMSADAKKYTAKLGMDGTDITRIQTRLYEMGYLVSSDMVTGHFGDVTESAVKKMQTNNGLTADGKVGSMTAELLYSGEAKPNLISYGEKSDIVLASQQRLKELGYLTTTPDGTYGNDTLAAVKQFQSRNDLVVDGYLGPSTREILNSSNAVPNGVMLGDNGDSVKRIQELLAKYGYMSSANATGYFGEVTEDAVKAFQKNNGLSADGNVGILTMSKLTGSDVKKANSQSSSSSGSQSKPSQNNSQSKPNSGSSNNSNSSSSGSGSVSSSVSSLVSVARSKVGAPYSWGSKGPSSFDCSGFVYWCLNQVGVKQSYITSSGWRNVGKYQKVSNFSSIKAGDIVVVRGHVGIAAGNGMVVDASSSSGRIVYRDLGDWWRSNFIVAWRIFG